MFSMSLFLRVTSVGRLTFVEFISDGFLTKVLIDDGIKVVRKTEKKNAKWEQERKKRKD